MIYIYIGEFYHFNTIILGLLETYFHKYPNSNLNIITLPDYSFILKKQFTNNVNLIIPQKENKLYISYRREFEGNPSTGNENNFNIIKKYGNITPKSKLIETNSWFENCDYLVDWCKKNNYPEKGKNMYGLGISSKIKPSLGWSFYTYLKLKFPNKPWISEYKETNKDIFQLYNDLLLPFIQKKKKNYENYTLFNINKKIIIKNDCNFKYINIFPRLRQGSSWSKETHCSFINPKFWVKLLDEVNKLFPDLKIVVHGHQESCRELLSINENLVFTENIEDSIKFFNDSNLLVSPISGLVRLAMNCGVKNVIEILQPKSTHNSENYKPKKFSIYGEKNFNPFSTNFYSIRDKNIKIILSTINKLIID